MFLVKRNLNKNVFYKLYNIPMYTSKYSSGPNPQVADQSLKIQENLTPVVDKTKDVKHAPYQELDQIGITSFYERNLKSVHESTKLMLKKDRIIKALPFEDVPGPLVLKHLANIWKYFPAAGTQITRSFMINVLSAGPNFKLNEKVKLLSFLFNEYGPLVRWVGPMGGDIVLLSRPEHMQSVFDQEGPRPVRSAFDSLEHYRTKYRKFDFPGIFSIKGEEWDKQRASMDSSLRQSLGTVHSRVEICCDEVLALIPKLRNRQEELSTGAEHLFFKWSLECMGHVLFSERMTLLDGNDNPAGDALWLEESLIKATQALASCESGLQLWKLFETPSFRKLVDSCNALDSIIGQYIRQTEIEMHSKKSQDKKLVYSSQDTAEKRKIIISDTEPRVFIKALLLSENMKSDDILTSFMDMLIVGVNSTTSAMCFLMYHLSRSQRAQRRLYEELRNIPQSSGKAYFDQLKSAPYLQACIKESLRLVPPFPVITRVIPKNIVLDCYKIPRGTTMVMAMQVAGLKEENFDDCRRFYPERWLKQINADSGVQHPLATLPFGYGSRSCLGKGLADLMLSVLTAKLIGKYKVEYNYGDITPVTKLIAMPSQALRLRFTERM